MALDPSIPLGVRPAPPPENALAGLAQVSAIKSQSLQNALVTQEIGQRAAQAQKAQYEQSALDATNAALKSSNGDPNAAADQLIQAGYGDHGLALKSSALTFQKLQQETQQADLQDKVKTGETIANLIGPSIEKGDQAAYSVARAQAIQLGGRAGQLAAQAPLSVQDAAPLYRSMLGMAAQLKNQLSQAQTSEASGKGAQTQAEANILNQKAALQKQYVDQMNANPNAPTPIDSILPASLDQKAHDSYAATWRSQMKAGGVDAAKTVEDAAAQHAAQLAAETNPGVMRAKATQAAMNAQAILPTDVEKEKLLQPLRESAAAATGADKAALDQQISMTKDYIDKKSNIEGLAKVLNAAPTNKTASGNLPILTTSMINEMTGSQRRTGAEITTNKELGNEWDKLVTKWDQVKNGTANPKIVADTKELLQKIATQPYQEYTTNLNALGAITKRPIQPTVGPPDVNFASAPSDKKQALIDQYVNK
jgi:hypothetical protein